MARNKRDTLTREVLDQLIGEQEGDGMPVILAKRIDPQIPTTNNLRDYGFEGLKQEERYGKVTWEPHHNFVLTIDGETGNCRIPDTPNNRKRLERLSKGKFETVTRVVFDDVTGEKKEAQDVVNIPPTYQTMEGNMAESAIVNAVAKRVAEMLGKTEDLKPKIEAERVEDLPYRKRPKQSKVRRAPRPKPAEDILEPIQ